MFEQVEVYHRPSSVREAVRLLEHGNGRTKIVAGGTDLVVDADSSVRGLIDLTRCGLTYIRRQGSVYAIGATTTLAGLEESTAIGGLAGGILARAAATCGSVQIRNAATVGGNVANGSPAADLLTPLLALDAAVTVAGNRSRRSLPLAQYLAQRNVAAVRRSLLIEVSVPVPRGAGWAWSFRKLGRTALDISLVNVAVGIRAGRSGKLLSARIALGAVAPTAIRAAAAEASLEGRVLGTESIATAAEMAMGEVSPITDLRASADYRREMCRVLVRRALEDCSSQLGCSL